MLKKWKEAQNYKIVYTVEHTGYDKDVKDDFSNFESFEVGDLEKAVEIVNCRQKAGYYNINLYYTIYNEKGEHIIEDSVNDLEYVTNTSVTEQIQRQYDIIERQEKELEQYRAFMKKHNIEKVFQEFLNERDVKLVVAANW